MRRELSWSMMEKFEAFLQLPDDEFQERVLEAFDLARPRLKAGWPLKSGEPITDVEQAFLERLYVNHTDLYEQFRRGEAS